MTTEHDPRCDDNGWDHPGPCVIETEPECEHLSIDDPITEAQLLSGIRPREWTVRCEDCGATWTHHRNEQYD